MLDMFCPRWIIKAGYQYIFILFFLSRIFSTVNPEVLNIMIYNDVNETFFVAFKKNKTYTLRWTNQQSKSCGIGRRRKNLDP